MGYLAIVQYRDPSDPSREEVAIGSTRDLTSFVVVDGFANGLHSVTVFPLLIITNLIYSRAVYRAFVELTGFSEQSTGITGKYC